MSISQSNAGVELELFAGYRAYEKFNPREYLREYYRTIGSENSFLLNFYHKVYHSIPHGARLLEFGGGPTIYQLLSASRKADEIVFAEYLPQNRSEIARWISGSRDSFDWREFVDHVLTLEKKKVDEKNRAGLIEEVRSKVTRIVECNAYLPHILGVPQPKRFNVVSSAFCIECIDSNEDRFLDSLGKLIELIAEDGTLVLTMLKNAERFKIGEELFPAFPVDEMYMSTVLSSAGLSNINISTAPAEHDQGYEGFLAITAKRV